MALLGFLCILGVSFLGIIRSSLSGERINLFDPRSQSSYVGCVNLEYIYRTFPDKVPYQHGYTYLINFLMLKPGPDIDFTLWLKEQIGITFAGGGVTPTILGEFYLNFGETAVFIGMFLMGIFGRVINDYFISHKGSFLSTYYVWQFAHCISGGIANVIIMVIIYTIVYKGLLMLYHPNNSVQSL